MINTLLRLHKNVACAYACITGENRASGLASFYGAILCAGHFLNGYIYMVSLCLNMGIQDITGIILLLHHFTILGQENGQNMRAYHTVVRIAYYSIPV